MRPPPPRKDGPRPVLTPRGVSANAEDQRDDRSRKAENQQSLGASAGTGESPEFSGATPEEPTPQPPQSEESAGATSDGSATNRSCKSRLGSDGRLSDLSLELDGFQQQVSPEQNMDTDEVHIAEMGCVDIGELFRNTLGEKAEYHDRCNKVVDDFVERCVIRKHELAKKAEEEDPLQAATSLTPRYAPLSTDRGVFEVAIRALIRSVEVITEETLEEPFANVTEPDEYLRAYEVAAQKLSLVVEEHGCLQDHHELFEVVTLLLNLATRSAAILSRVHSRTGVSKLAPKKRAKTIYAARFVVEHPTMFSEMFRLRATKLAATMRFANHKEEGGVEWVPNYGRHHMDAAH